MQFVLNSPIHPDDYENYFPLAGQQPQFWKLPILVTGSENLLHFMNGKRCICISYMLIHARTHTHSRMSSSHAYRAHSTPSRLPPGQRSTKFVHLVNAIPACSWRRQEVQHVTVTRVVPSSLHPRPFETLVWVVWGGSALPPTPPHCIVHQDDYVIDWRYELGGRSVWTLVMT